MDHINHPLLLFVLSVVAAFTLGFTSSDCDETAEFAARFVIACFIVALLYGAISYFAS